MQKEKTVGRQCVGTQIADILEERILQNIYPVGRKLPPERQLAEEFGVSRQSFEGGFADFVGARDALCAAGGWTLCFRAGESGFATRLGGGGRQARYGRRGIGFPPQCGGFACRFGGAAADGSGFAASALLACGVGVGLRAA